MSATPKQLQKYFETKLAAEVGPHGLRKLWDTNQKGITILDVRRAEDFRVEHIPGAINIPLEQLEKRFKEVSKKNQVVAYCYSITCFSAPKAAAFLAKKGYRVAELVGGIAEWKNCGFSIETGSVSVVPERELVAA